MRVAGVGFRQAASVASLRDALRAAGGTDGLAALATAEAKAGAAVLEALAKELALPIRGVTPEAMAAVETLTRSKRAIEMFGAGSVAEAAAMAAAGCGARLIGPRTVSADGLATAAIAEGAEI